MGNLFVSEFWPFLYSGNTPETRGTAFVVYEDIFDAKNACDHLSGFNVCNRYLVVLYYQSTKVRVENLVCFVAKSGSKVVNRCSDLGYPWLQGWHSGESTRLPPM